MDNICTTTLLFKSRFSGQQGFKAVRLHHSILCHFGRWSFFLAANCDGEWWSLQWNEDLDRPHGRNFGRSADEDRVILCP